MMVVTDIHVEDIFKECPCGKTNHNDLERIKRNLIQRTFLFFLPLKRYYCYKCKRKVSKLN